MNKEEFKALHVKFLREHSERSTSWFLKIPTERPRTRWFLSVLPSIKGLDVLDLCGGYGELGAYLQAVKKFSFNYTCLDKNKHRIACGPNYFKALGLKKPKFLLCDANNLLFSQGTFDMVWLFGWCDPFFNCDALFRKIFEILKPRGLFLFNMAKSMAKYKKYKTRYTKENLLTLLKRVGFNVSYLKSITSIDFGVVAKKCL